ncbi:MAG TPA: phosphate signaling complex protein PhoU [Croceibacterium sp.]|nr:phosphate signaling complex protein PhoU [Croceibacterium sp.]
MSTSGHTLKAFDEELEELRISISEMGGLAEMAIRDSMEALTTRNLELAAAVVERDLRIDEIESDVERRAIRIMALRAPLANDLREVVAALKISGVIERIGDYAKNIAKRVPNIENSRIETISLLPEMARVSGEMVSDALDAFSARDAAKAAMVLGRDQVVDNFYNSIFRALLTVMMEDAHTITAAAHLLFIAKHLERIGDHATNVAEMVYFADTGQHIPDRHRGEDLDAIQAKALDGAD